MIPCTAHWSMTANTWPADLHDQWAIASAYPMPGAYIYPWLDVPIEIFGFSILVQEGNPSWLMVGTQGFISDGMLFLGAGEKEKTVLFPDGIRAPMKARAEESPYTLINVHGSCSGQIKILLTVYYTPAAPQSPPAGWGPVFEQTLDADSNSFDGYTVVQRLVPVAHSGMPTQAKATFKAIPSVGLAISEAYISHASGSGYFCADKAPLKVGTSTSFAASPGGVVTALADFAWDKTSPLLVSYYVSHATNNRIKGKTTLSGSSAYWKAGNDAATLNKSGYTTAGFNLLGISKLEMNGF